MPPRDPCFEGAGHGWPAARWAESFGEGASDLLLYLSQGAILRHRTPLSAEVGACGGLAALQRVQRIAQRVLPDLGNTHPPLEETDHALAPEIVERQVGCSDSVQARLNATPMLFAL